VALLSSFVFKEKTDSEPVLTERLQKVPPVVFICNDDIESNLHYYIGSRNHKGNDKQGRSSEGDKSGEYDGRRVWRRTSFWSDGSRI
jgi:hypothetical protein